MAGTPARGPLQLLGITGWPLAARLGAIAALLAAGGGFGWGTYALQVLYRQRVARGDSLAAWQNLFRLGAPWPPLVPVAAGALLLALGWWHLRHAEPEPSHGLVRRPGREWTATEIRHHLRRERGVMRIGFAALSAVTVLVSVRLGVYGVLALRGDTVAGRTVVGVVAEVVVCAAAWVAGSAWLAAYLERLAQWGVRD